jgi:CubicO group peptidase (beta-lactamase class C family)
MYSCLNFITLQRILEKVTGQKLYEYAHENIFAPLALKHTCYFPLDPSLPKVPGVDYDALAALCAPTTVQADGLPLVARVHDPIARRIMSGNSGNAGMFSDARDLCTICSVIMKCGEGILKPATVRLMTTVPEENDPKVGRALGWDTKNDFTICHTGYTGTSVEIDLKNHTAIILLTNRVHPEDKGSVRDLRLKVSGIVTSSLNEDK